jgi:nucleoside recognition membrane protein YjiH
MHLFPTVFLAYFFCIYFLAFVLVRMWPIRSKPTSYLGASQPEVEITGNARHYLVTAWRHALDKAATAPSLPTSLRRALLDGVLLSASVLGLILAIGTAALVIANHTLLFDYLSWPLVPLLRVLGLPNPDVVAQATVAGIAEVYIPALLARDAAVPAKFFVAVMSISQLIFFSSVAPMMLEMFRQVPIRAHELILLFVIRTLILIPLLAALVAILF